MITIEDIQGNMLSLYKDGEFWQYLRFDDAVSAREFLNEFVHGRIVCNV